MNKHPKLIIHFSSSKPIVIALLCIDICSVDRILLWIPAIMCSLASLGRLAIPFLCMCGPTHCCRQEVQDSETD